MSAFSKYILAGSLACIVSMVGNQFLSISGGIRQMNSSLSHSAKKSAARNQQQAPSSPAPLMKMNSKVASSSF